MPDYLLIHGQSDSAVINAMAVAEDLQRKQGAQVDIVVPPERQAIAELCLTLRRVVAVDIAPSVPQLPLAELKTELQSEHGGWKNKLLAATQSRALLNTVKSGVKSVAEAALSNFRQYRDLLDELRLVGYDAVIDLDANAFSMLVSRAAKTKKIIGFAAANINNAPAGLELLYHETRVVPKNLSRLQQCRQLAARTLGYEPDPQPAWQLKPCPPPPWMPPTPFILVGGKVPPPFVKTAAAAGLPLLGDFPDSAIKPPAPPAIGDWAALAKAAAVVIDSDVFAALATATGTPTIFIGGKKDMPDNALLAESPAALQSALSECLSASAKTITAEKLPPAAATADSSAPADALRLKE